MKPKIIKLSTVVLLLLFIGASCQKDKMEYADESIEISTFPGITIYKTKKDYINYISLQITDDDKLNAIPDYTLNKNDPRITVDSHGQVKLNSRWRLKSGYIVDKGSSSRDVFTNISIQEYVDWNTNHQVAGWPSDLIWPRIIDRDPFLEYYHSKNGAIQGETITIGEINDMIETGTLEEYFTRLK